MTTISDDLRVLKEAREYFADSSHWTTDYYGRMVGNRPITDSLVVTEHLLICDSHRHPECAFSVGTEEFRLVKEEAVCRCLVGELAVAAGMPFDAAEHRFHSLFTYLGLFGGVLALSWDSLHELNDNEGYEAVLNLLDRAIEKLERRVPTDAG